MKIYFLNFWTREKFEDLWFYKAIHKFISPNPEICEHEPDIAFFSVFGLRKNITEYIIRHRPRIKIFFTGENTEGQTNTQNYDDYLLSIMDLSLGFKHLNHSRYIRTPLWMYYGYFIEDLGRKGHLWSDIEKYKNHPKKKFCCLIARSDLSGNRKKIYKILNSIGRVDCPGRLFHNTGDFYIPVGENHKLNYLKDYKFTICCENSRGNGYTTEKLMHSFMCGTIPIYWGENPVEPEFFDQNQVLFFDENNKRSLKDRIIELNNIDYEVQPLPINKEKVTDLLKQVINRTSMLHDGKPRISSTLEIKYKTLLKIINDRVIYESGNYWILRIFLIINNFIVKKYKKIRMVVEFLRTVKLHLIVSFLSFIRFHLIQRLKLDTYLQLPKLIENV